MAAGQAASGPARRGAAHDGHGAGPGLERAMNRKARRQREKLARRRAGASGPAAPGPAGEAGAALAAAIRHHRLGQLQQAEVLYRQVLAAQPDNPDALHLLGAIAYRFGRHDAAVDLIRRAVVLAPGNAEAHNSLGSALQALDRQEEAIAAFRSTLDIMPDHVQAHSNLGVALNATGDPEAAIAAFRHALDIRPDYAEVQVNLGAAQKDMGRLDEAVATLRRALELKPDDAKAHGNLGSALNDLGRFDDALAHYDQALKHDPEDVDALCNRAVPLLRQGRLEQGWRAYEHRLGKREAQRLPVAAPEWDGGALDGRTVLVRAEQGIGDEILFASCFPELIARAGHCVIECAPRLERLFARSFPTATVRGGARDDPSWLADAPAIDVHVMLGSLMRHFRPRLESFPDHDGYLRPDPAARGRFIARLAALGPGLKVGISWRSMRGSRWQVSYTALEDWRDILTLPDVRFVNLQYDDPGAALADVDNRLGVHVEDFVDLDLMNDMDGTAALISALDLVIAPANTVANLAGALGARLWLLDLDSTWSSLGTEASPWFPGASVYRRTSGTAGWDAALGQVARGLRDLGT